MPGGDTTYPNRFSAVVMNEPNIGSCLNIIYPMHTNIMKQIRKMMKNFDRSVIIFNIILMRGPKKRLTAKASTAQNH